METDLGLERGFVLAVALAYMEYLTEREVRLELSTAKGVWLTYTYVLQSYIAAAHG